MKFYKIKYLPLALVAVCLIGLVLLPAARSAPTENHCFTCHTNPRKLIEITREISKTNLNKPGASTETEGEG